MILDVPAFVRDGSVPVGTVPPGLPTALNILWPRGEDGTLRLTVKRQDLSAFDLTGAAIVFGLRKYSNDTAALVSRQATIVDAAAGRADVPLVQADTVLLEDSTDFYYDVQLTDPAGKRWQVVPRSLLRIDPIFAIPTDSVTVPPSASPLALGPSWLELGYTPQVQSDTTTAEQLPAGLEAVWNFDDGTGLLANLFARLCAIAHVTGGTGTVRVRYGGTAGLPDGTVLLTSDPLVATSDAVIAKSATVAKPVGTQLVKVTIQNDTAGQRTLLRGVTLRARGST